jgi:DNA repair and recombination protein RAD54B
MQSLLIFVCLQKEVVNTFIIGAVAPVLIISYELLRKHIKELKKLSHCLVVCDEGHRLKNSGGNKTIAALSALQTARRLILTGTPIQNDLSEFFAMCDFSNPGVLGSLSTFRNTYEKVIQVGEITLASVNLIISFPLLSITHSCIPSLLSLPFFTRPAATAPRRLRTVVCRRRARQSSRD